MIASIVALRIPTGTVEASLGLDVVKSGRTTWTTTGRVIDVNATTAVNFGVGVAYFNNQILTTPMSQGGDSGSLLMSLSDRLATGLLFAVAERRNHTEVSINRASSPSRMRSRPNAKLAASS